MNFLKSIAQPPTTYTPPPPRPPKQTIPRPPPRPQSSQATAPPPRPPKIPENSIPLTQEALRWRDQGDDVVSQRFDDVMSMVDPSDNQSLASFTTNAQSLYESRKTGVFKSALTGRYFDKILLYENARVSLSLPPCFLPSSSWKIVLLAAHYSNVSYQSSSSRESVIASDRRSNTKAMLVKAIPSATSTTIVIAVRGTSSLKDWMTNMQYEPEQPGLFLRDQENAIHSGFLGAARAMMPSVASHLQDMIRQQSLSQASPPSYTLVISGHSAGGAIAALLYSHMLSASSSPLSSLAGLFHRIHCITFGAPPLSLLPLTTHYQKSMFLSFVNEGDAVTRAEMPYMRSLLDLLAAPAPKRSRRWPIPENALCNAGKIVVLRQPGKRKDKMELAEGVEAVLCKESNLRGVVFGNPLCHLMDVYEERVNKLAGKS
ncbi:hypothetical protein VHEMI08541 [[Torrubiella] hemipterigena]|uniref:sn-1-specific diacylglycerol lipase n=1 Tax=[Torrubiella] hemipterigena TaxID=1531966 RepID=A0A0A1TDT2_9HYPO|nr:hypothetical protein VHEMI08541 [[Torrubiella] hemipterigena]